MPCQEQTKQEPPLPPTQHGQNTSNKQSCKIKCYVEWELYRGAVAVRICHFSFLQQSNEEVAFSRYKGRENERLHSPYSDNSPSRWNVHLQSPSAPTGSTLHSLHSAADIRRYTGKPVLAFPLVEGGEPANTSKTGVQIGYGWVEHLGVLNLDLI